METHAKIARTGNNANAMAGRKVHLIGMGGSGMRALAQMLIGHSAVVSGSDMRSSLALEHLVEEGADVRIGQNAENIPQDVDVVVYSAAIHEQNPELLAARERGLELMKYSQMLGRLMEGRQGVAIAGTHGKSTTSAMVAYALCACGHDPSYIIGATVDQLGGPSGVGHGRCFVAEACEYDRSFLNLRPSCGAILNVEEDHLDCYSDLDAIVEAFRAFSSMVSPEGMLVVNGEDAEAMAASDGASCEVQSFGFAESCRWRGANESVEMGCFGMDVALDDDVLCRVKMSIPGRHNAYNALAATAVLHNVGLTGDEIASALGAFTGVRRRLTFKGNAGGITVVDDFAHHPTEISASLRAIREHYRPERLICVFQPHQHSRTRFLLKDFARSFNLADETIVPDIYFVRDSQQERNHISSGDLVSQIRLNGGTPTYLQTFDEIVDHLKADLRNGDVLVTMGAGNIWEVADRVVRWLHKH